MTGSATLPLAEFVCCVPLVRQPLTASAATDLDWTLKAIADPARLRLLSMIAAHEGGEACVCDLTNLSAPTGPDRHRPSVLAPHEMSSTASRIDVTRSGRIGARHVTSGATRSHASTGSHRQITIRVNLAATAVSARSGYSRG